MEEPSIPDLTSEQIEALCEMAEQAARKLILSKVPLKIVEKMNIAVEAEGTKPLNLGVEVDIRLSTEYGDYDLQQLADDAAKEVVKASESTMRYLK